MVDPNKNKLRTIRIYCTRIGCFLFAAQLLGPFLLIIYLRNYACSAHEVESLAERGFVLLLIVLAVSSFFFSVGAALQDHYSTWDKAIIFTLNLAVSLMIFVGPFFIPQTRLRMEMEWIQAKSTIEKYFQQHPGQSPSHRSCVLHR